MNILKSGTAQVKLFSLEILLEEFILGSAFVVPVRDLTPRLICR